MKPKTQDIVFKSLIAALSRHFAITARDKSIASLITSVGSRIETRLRDIEASLLLPQTTTSAINANDYIEIKRLVAKNVEAAHKFLAIETTKGQKLYPITKLFVPPSFYNYKDEDDVDLSVDLFVSIDDIVGLEQVRDMSRVSYHSLRSGLNRVVVLGDPGGGKSTTVQHICYEGARTINLPQKLEDFGHDSSRHRLPLKFIMRVFEKERQNRANLSIRDFLLSELQHYTNLSNGRCASFLDFILLNGSCIILFDGLDEVLDVATRREFVSLIQNFCRVYPKVPVLITSRLKGYGDAPLGDEFDVVKLSPLDQKQVESYARNMIAAVKAKPKKDIEDDVLRFMEQTARNASDLRQNPLLLGLMVWLFANRGDVPRNRPEIYRDCSVLLFEQWDQNRGIRFPIPEDFDPMDTFAFLASEIFGDVSLAEGVTRDWLKAKLNEYFTAWYEERPKATATTKLVLEFITGRAWVMSEVGQNLFGFTHRTFLEYFFANRLAKDCDSMSQLFEQLKRRILEGEWDVICHLAFQIKTDRQPRRVNEFVLSYAKSVTAVGPASVRNRAKLHNILQFGSQSAEYLMMSEPTHKRLLETITHRSIELSISGETFALNYLGYLLKHADKRTAFVSRSILNEIEKYPFADPAALCELIINLLVVPQRRSSDRRITAQRDLYDRARNFELDERTRMHKIAAEYLSRKSDFYHSRLDLALNPLKLATYYAHYGLPIVFAHLESKILSLGSPLMETLRPMILRPIMNGSENYAQIFLDLYDEILRDQSLETEPSPQTAVVADFNRLGIAVFSEDFLDRPKVPFLFTGFIALIHFIRAKRYLNLEQQAAFYNRTGVVLARLRSRKSDSVVQSRLIAAIEMVHQRR